MKNFLTKSGYPLPYIRLFCAVFAGLARNFFRFPPRRRGRNKFSLSCTICRNIDLLQSRHRRSRMTRLLMVAAAAFLSIPIAAQTGAAPSTNPRVRAITAFVRLDRSAWEKQIGEALVVLRKTQNEFEAAGYQVESIRIVTQSLGELVAGLSEDDAVAYLARLDALSTKESFLPNVGPGMMHDTDDP